MTMRHSYKFSFSLILILFSLSLVSSHESTKNLVNKFLRCLPNHANSSISTAIFTPQDPSFLSVLQSYNRNLRFLIPPDTPKPMAIITALHVTHAQAVISCAKQFALHIRIRSGGHDYEGLSYTSASNNVPFIILDMFNLRSIDVYKTDNNNSTTVRVQAGATIGELYYRISQESPILAFPAGVCPTMGVGGHFSGGGYGNLMRKFGLSVDNIIDAEFIDANGTLHNRETMGEDVFWAIRGGGAASFGVVISWLIKLVEVPKTVTVFEVKMNYQGKNGNFSVPNPIDVAYRWQYIAPNLPKELFITVYHEVTTLIAEGPYAIAVSYIGLFLGTSKDVMLLMDKSFPELGLKQKDCQEMSWINSTVFFMNSPYSESFPDATIENLLDRQPTGPHTVNYFKGKSDYVKKPISKEGIQSIWDNMIELEAMEMQWSPYGGRMSEISETATPFPHRVGNLFKIEYPLAWPDDGDNVEGLVIPVYLNRSSEIYNFMTPFVSSSPREAFFNYRDLDIGANPSDDINYEVAKEYGSKYFKGNFDRLVSVKTKIDPDNFFRNEQSIPTLPK